MTTSAARPNLMIMVTPYIAEPMQPSEAARPDDGFVEAFDPQAVLLGRLNQIYGTSWRLQSRTRRSRALRLHRRLRAGTSGNTYAHYRRKVSTDVRHADQEFRSPLQQAMHLPRKAGLVITVLTGLVLAACSQDRVVQTGSIYPYDYPRPASDRPQREASSSRHLRAWREAGRAPEG